MTGSQRRVLAVVRPRRGITVLGSALLETSATITTTCDESASYIVVANPTSTGVAPNIGIYNRSVRCGRSVTTVSVAFGGRDVQDKETADFLRPFELAADRLAGVAR